MVTSDPTVTLEDKLLAFADLLSPDELTVLHETIHLATEACSEVHGFVFTRPVGPSADPCEGGEVTFPNTFAMLGNLHTKLHDRRSGSPPAPR